MFVPSVIIVNAKAVKLGKTNFLKVIRLKNTIFTVRRNLSFLTLFSIKD
jgi:hypothetical protein